MGGNHSVFHIYRLVKIPIIFKNSKGIAILFRENLQ